MTKRRVPARTLWVVAAAIWTAILILGVGPLPSPARLFNPHDGLWSHRSQKVGATTLPGLKQPVHIAWDSYGVPHVFAASEEDAYLAQGYLMASQRLFQMDLSTRVTAGRLSEWVGARTQALDHFNIRFGMRRSARKNLEALKQDPRAYAMLKAFTAGANHYIRTRTQTPPEYTILGVEPEPFDELKVMYMAKNLTFNLAGRSFDVWLTQIRKQIGLEKTLALFPERLPATFEDFIYPSQGPARRHEQPQDFAFQPVFTEYPFYPQPFTGQGSNNWAVGPKRSATGRSLLANDTHLGLSLPNIWYELQLHTPSFNVYGVALTAVPGIILGFNSHVAWATTNGTTDVLDYYQVEFESETSLNYKHKGELKTAIQEQEIWRDQRGQEQPIEVLWTDLGPVVHRQGRFGLVVDWAGYRTSHELIAVRALQTATDLNTCQQAFRHWDVPIQNSICADKAGVSLEHTGFVPKRPVGHGRFVMDGTQADPLMQGEARVFGLRMSNPPEGFVLSANQKAVGPEDARYLGWDYEDPYRGMIIRRRLSAKEKITPEDMMRLQNDPFDAFAEQALPRLLKWLDESALSQDQKQMVVRLKAWTSDVLADQPESAVFRAWFNQVRHTLFRDDYNDVPLFPKDGRILWMLDRASDERDADREFFQVSPQALVTDAFLSAWRDLTRAQGEDSNRWTWAAFNQAEIRHVGRIPGFGSELLPMNGSGDSVRGNKGQQGPVYKMVVEVGDEPRAWIQVPGHNSGNPFAPEFESHVRDWAEGKMRPVEYYRDLDDAKARALRLSVFAPGGP